VTREESHRPGDTLPEVLSEGGVEPLGAENREAVKQGEAEIARGEFVTWEELKQELGL
jgi:hypothetical protein